MSDRMRRIHRIHFVGIGGSGMSGIAEVLVNLGYEVQGSDLKPNVVTERLGKLGARVMIGHRAENVGDADVVVISSAVSQQNPEVVAALQRRIPVVPRAEMLGELMRFRYAIAVAARTARRRRPVSPRRSSPRAVKIRRSSSADCSRAPAPTRGLAQASTSSRKPMRVMPRSCI